MSSGTRTSAQSSHDGNPPALDLSGRTLGDYHVLRKLGQGGMGQVYLAEQISLKRKVALKILRPDLAATPQALERFKREALSVARATHANIVQVYQFDQHEGLHYMVLEYVEGRNLKDYLARKGTPDLLVALSIMRQVASALQRAHELGIVHRDIKPENILLTRKGEVKVADFGLSRRLEGDQAALNLTQTGVTMGTPLYMSPEQVEGKETDARTDIYSFGVTCYHMLTGQPPFTGATAFEVAIQHVNKPPSPLAQLRPDLPEALCSIVLKMMAKDPAQRYQTARELLRDIVRLREGLSGVSPATVQPTVTVETPALPSTDDSFPSATLPGGNHRRLWFLGGVIGSLLLATALGAALAWFDRRRQGPMPGSADVKPSDASVVETILLPNRREQALWTLVDQALNPPAGKSPDVTAFGNCMELGLLYLDNDRLDEAEKLFTRLEAFKQPPSFRMLGQLGKAIVLALKSKPKESNRLLCEVMAPEGRFVGPIGKGKKPGGNLNQLLRQLLPIRPFLDDPRGKHWLGQARLYNARNGIPPAQVPRYLLVNFPLENEKR